MESALNYPSIVEALVFQIQALKEEVKAVKEFKPKAKRPLLHIWCKPVDPVRSERAKNAKQDALKRKREVYFAVIDKLTELGIPFGEVCKNHDTSFDFGSRYLYKMAGTANRRWFDNSLLNNNEKDLIIALENLTGIRICED